MTFKKAYIWKPLATIGLIPVLPSKALSALAFLSRGEVIEGGFASHFGQWLLARKQQNMMRSPWKARRYFLVPSVSLSTRSCRSKDRPHLPSSLTGKQEFFFLHVCPDVGMYVHNSIFTLLIKWILMGDKVGSHWSTNAYFSEMIGQEPVFRTEYCLSMSPNSVSSKVLALLGIKNGPETPWVYPWRKEGMIAVGICMYM